MLYCRRCAKDVEFNSVASNQAKGALTLDNPNSSIDPTLILSETKIINVCKICGDIVKQRSEWKRIEKDNREQQKTNNAVAPIVGIFFALLTILIYSKYLKSTKQNFEKIINMGIIAVK